MSHKEENYKEISKVPGTGEDKGYTVTKETYPAEYVPDGAWTSTEYVPGTGQDEGYLVSRQVVRGYH